MENILVAPQNAKPRIIIWFRNSTSGSFLVTQWLRIWCHCSGFGRCCGAGSTSVLGTFTCYRHTRKKKTKKTKNKKQSTQTRNFTFRYISKGNETRNLNRHLHANFCYGIIIIIFLVPHLRHMEVPRLGVKWSCSCWPTPQPRDPRSKPHLRPMPQPMAMSDP